MSIYCNASFYMVFCIFSKGHFYLVRIALFRSFLILYSSFFSHPDWQQCLCASILCRRTHIEPSALLHCLLSLPPCCGQEFRQRLSVGKSRGVVSVLCYHNQLHARVQGWVQEKAQSLQLNGLAVGGLLWNAVVFGLCSVVSV